LKKTKGESFTL